MHIIIRSLAIIFLGVATAAGETRESLHMADAVFPKRRCVIEVVDGFPHGMCRAFDDHGRLILTEQYVRGKVHGKRICFYPSGVKFSEMTFEDGLAEGETTTWFEDGKIASTDHMKHGVPNGLQTLYYPDGGKSVETPHVNAVAHGTCRHYLPDGRLFALSTFENGVEIGRQVLIEPTREEYPKIVDASQFSPRLTDHWPAAGPKNRKPSGTVNVGDHVEVEWKGTWYPAQVLRHEKRGYFIHYLGFDSSWDEYVHGDRIRAAQH